MSVNDALMVLKRIGIAYKEVCKPVVSEFSIPQIEFDILMILSQSSEYSTAKSMCEIIHAKANVMSLHVDKLVSNGYIERTVDENDRRRIKLRCTEKAAPIIERGTEIKNKFLSGLCVNLSEERLKEFCMTLDVIGDNADRMSSGERCI